MKRHTAKVTAGIAMQPLDNWRITRGYMGAFSPPSDTVRAADLLERQEMLTEEAPHLGAASYRRRCEIEALLAEIHCLLKQFGLRDKNLSWRAAAFSVER